MPKVSNFKRLRKSSSKFPKDTPVKRSGGETSLDPAKKLSTQQTLSKFFSLNSGKNEYTTKKRSSEISEDPASLDDFPGYSPPKLLKSDHSHGTGKRKREQVSPHTVQKLQGFSLDSTECASVARHDVINSTPLTHRDKGTLLISAKPYADRDLVGENFSGGGEEDCETPSSSANYKSKEIMCSKRFKNNGTSKSVLEAADAKNKLTPLEKQVVELKKQHPDVLLLIECGYKYRFFGEDAEVASKELNIICYLDHNFYTACIPTYRLFVHVQRLVAQGYKVGVVKQTETAALKAAGENKNTLFQRKLQALYTKATLIGEEFNALCPTNSEHGETSPVISGYLACVYEVPALSKQKFDVSVAVVAVHPSSGDTFYSTFKDTPTRTELESCLTRLNPVELLLPISSLSERTESLIQNMCFQSSACGSKIRVERMADSSFEYTSALNKVMEFYGSNDGICGSNSDDVQKITDLCPEVICCLAALIAYLKDFNLDSILKNMNTLKSSMSSANCMSLNAITMRNLEIFQNLGNYSEQGSLLWAVNHTSTKFGKKMLHSWIASPLKDIVQIEERLDVITEMLHSDSSVFPVIEKTLAKLPDLERGLCSALYQRCSCWEFYVLVQSLTSVRREFQAISERASSEIQTVKLKDIVSEIIYLLEGIDSFSENLHENSARENDKTTLFLDTSKYPAVVDTQQRIKDGEKNLKDLRTGIAKVLRLPAFDYCTVSGQKYLIEVHNKSVSVVPSDWVKISGTKQVSRFRSPEVEMLHNQLRQLNEQLLVNCDESWKMFLIEFGSFFYNYKKAVTLLAELDCYFSMAKFSKQQGYCRPVIVNSEKQILNITQGRNPVVEKLLGEHCQYVANDTKLNSEKCCMIITGPNMGGKSSYVRQVAIITILAQMGCYVPAESATLSMFDGIYMRMGASDDLYLKRSTFMTEMQETSDILLHATSKSLVVLDELGRGTSTHDGMAIAYSTLNFLLEKVNCITLFVTHYPPVAELKKLYPKKVSNNHMTFIVSQNDNKKSGIGTLTFLYSVSEGIAEKSYGINVADLAEIPVEVLNEAKKRSQELERCIQQRRFLKDIVGCVFSFTKTAAEKLDYLQKLCLD